MNKNINRKKISISKKLLYLFFFLLFTFIFFFSYSNLNKLDNFFISSIKQFSSKYNYNLNSYKINDLNYIDRNEIIKIVRPYFNTSIFLLPLEDISRSILENNWVEKVKINIDYKNTIFISILEFEPIGIYQFNNGSYYFNSNGKIIDYKSVNHYNKKLIIFTGQSSTLNASLLLDTIKHVKNDFKNNIRKAHYIGDRRWNLFLKNGILVKLSEKKFKQSIENYLNLSNKFKYNDLTDIKVIDLRDSDKAIIEYK